MSGLTRLVLTHFRNYPSAHLTCDLRPVVLTGSNGAGKTNILEALSFLSPGRGLRRAKLSEISHAVEGQKETEASPSAWGVAVSLSTPQGAWEMGTALEVHQDGKERRLVQVEGTLLKSQTLLGDYVRVLWLTPQMDRLFQEGSAPRRRFLDRLVYSFDPSHALRVTRYEHYMRERSRLLKEGRGDSRWFEALEAHISAQGIAVCVARLDFIERLHQAKTWALGNFPQARLALTGEVETWLMNHSALEAEEKFKEALKNTRHRDKEGGSPAQGPHRSDFSALYKEKNREASVCSTGEQKALLISIIFATARLQGLEKTGTPLVLLDEIIAHLDEKRREALFEEILSLKMQAWMTGTDPDLFKPFQKKVQRFHVKNAVIQSCDND